MLKEALSYISSGLSVIPTRHDTKQPLVKWKKWQSEIASEELIRSWFDEEDSSIALVCGGVSGNVEIIDIDNHFDDALQIYQHFIELVEGTMPGLEKKLTVQTTQSGGYHIIYRAPEIEGNLKLARRWKDNNQQDTLIETRGEGGYALISPSPGYDLIAGNFTDIQTITDEEREFLHAVALSFDEIDDSQPDENELNPQLNAPDKPGSVFNTEGDITDTLLSKGWQIAFKRENTVYWRRPGKNRGISATFNAGGKLQQNKFYVFSSNAYPFESGKSYSKFAVEAILNHSGDFKECAKSLSKKGYGRLTNGNGTTKTKTLKSQAVDIGNDGSIFIDKIGNTDIGNSQRFFNMWSGKVKFDHIAQRWYIWNGHYWQSDDLQQIVEFAKSTVRSIKIEALGLDDTDKQNNLLRHAVKSESSASISAMLKLAQSMPGIACTANDFDKINQYYNLKNGTFDLHENRLIEHNPDNMISKISNIDYNPDASCVTWLAALFTYFDDDVEQVKFIQKICGLTLCGDHLEEVVFFLYGLGKNGKSVFIKVLEMIYGDYSQKAPVEMLLLNNSDSSIPNDVARLKGARFVVTSELPKGKRLNENRIKDLSGGDKITARFLHKEFFEFRPSCKIWIYGNHKPIVHGNDEGIWRRIILIPFLVTIPEEDRKPASELQASFEAEKEGILNWMIEGWKLYQQEGLNPPDSVMEATQAYREEQDILIDFLKDCCDTSSTVNRVYAKDLHNAYLKWCDENKEASIKSRSFYLILEEKGFKRVESSHGNKKEFLGISLKNDLF